MQPNMQQPTEATYTSITEYMNICQIRLEVIIQENMQEIKTETYTIVVRHNQESKTEEPIVANKKRAVIQTIKDSVPNATKEKWKYLEAILETYKATEVTYKSETKKKRGRPPKKELQSL